MSDGAHPELDFDPLDDTQRWPEDQFLLLPVGRIVLNKNPDNVFAETEQSAFGTGVLVAGIDHEQAKALPPLPGKPAPHQNRPGSTYPSGKLESGDAAGKEPSTSEEAAAK